MMATLRQMRRAPFRLGVSVAAIALAIAAIGVFAVPGVAESSLRDLATADQLAHVNISTTPIDATAIPSTQQVTGVEHIEGRISGTVPLANGQNILVVGTSAQSQLDRVHVSEGRLASAPGEALVSAGVGDIGETITPIEGSPLVVVGIGQTTWFAENDAIYVMPQTAQALTGVAGPNAVVARLADPNQGNLDRAVSEIRSLIEVAGGQVTTFPDTLVDGAHPIESDLTQISFMIGSLGVVAGVVALILLASTANAVVTERSGDAAVMRALGGSRRAVRRDLRRLAVVVGVLGTVIGIPLGLLVANVVARMVLTRFAGITPAIGFDLTVIVASILFGVLGARIVSGRVARRVCNADLATALRDRDAVPFGTRRTDRMLSRLPIGGIMFRMSLRAVARRKSRALAVSAQFAAAVAAAVLVASLAASIVDFNGAELETYNWATQTQPNDAVYPFSLDGSSPSETEVALYREVELDGWELEIYGVDPATVMVDTEVSAGTWLPSDPVALGSPAPAVLAEKFAEQEGYALGDLVTVDLPAGPVEYEVVGLHPIRSVAIFTSVETLARDLNAAGHGNLLWTTGSASPPDAGHIATTTVNQDALFSEDAASRDAVVAIFFAIGAIVVIIAALGIASTVSMNLHERRRELGTAMATGAQRRDIRWLLGMELVGLATIGWAMGAVAGIAGAGAIMQFFETSNAVELGFAVAWNAVPAALVVAFVFVALLAQSAARQSQRSPLAQTLRAAT